VGLKIYVQTLVWEVAEWRWIQQHAQHQLSSLAQSTTVHALRDATRDITEDELHAEGGIEALAPAQARTIIAGIEELGPQLHAVEPTLQAIAPLLEDLSASSLDNPANTGVYHEQIVPGWANKFSLVFVDLVTEHAGSILDAQVSTMVGAQLTNGGAGSECARALCDQLHIVPETFAGAIDAVLDHELAATLSRPAMTLRTALCKPKPVASATSAKPATSAASHPAAPSAANAAGNSAASAVSPAATAAISLLPDLGAISLDTTLAVPMQGSATARELLCTPKPSGARPIEGVLFEVARLKGGAEIRKFVDGWGNFLGLPGDALTRMVNDLTGRLARNLYLRMNLTGLCG
jgi:hypothetical protein